MLGAVAPPRLLTALRDLVIPSACAVCDMPGDPLCPACMRVLAPPQGPCCARCGHPWHHDVPTCAECPPGLTWVRHALQYDPAVARVMGALKDAGRRALADPLAALMCASIAHPGPGAVLVPVAQSPDRRRERGFNQAALLATGLAREWGLPVHDALTRADGPRHQRGSSRAERLQQVPGAFASIGRAPHHAVLVDDVLTTGATLSAAARALRGAGCARVGAVVTARVVLAGRATRVG